MTQWYLPELVDRIQALLGPDYPVSTDVPVNQSAWMTVPVFGVAKDQGRSIPEMAHDTTKRLSQLDGIQVTVVGGFVNITPRDVSPVLTQAAHDRYGDHVVPRNQTVVIDFSSPNIAKPMSIGHLRSTILGDALQRLYQSSGYTVVSVNHIGDWGTQFGKLLVAYEHHYGDLNPRPELGIHDLLKLYVDFHQSAEIDPDLDDAAREMFHRLETGDVVVHTLWQSLVSSSLREFQQIYDRLGVTFTEPTMGESFYQDQLAGIINQATTAGVAVESAGALVISLPGASTPLLLRKRDGATLYATRDLATVKYRVKTYHPVSILYVVANEQAFHFQQLFAASKQLDLVPEGTELVHVKFGLMRLPEGKMSTRQGRVVFLSAVVDEAVARARAVVESKNPDLLGAAKDQIAKVIGIGALKYFDLSHDRKKDIIFDWDRMLSLTGDSAPYLQYAYVRAFRIIQSVGREQLTTHPSRLASDEADNVQLTPSETPADIGQLILSLARFPLVIETSVTTNSPHHLAQYLNLLATEFNRFYETYPVLQAEGPDRELRVRIVAGVANVLRRGLNFLGIDVVEAM